jgi:hypothetical protein
MSTFYAYLGIAPLFQKVFGRLTPQQTEVLDHLLVVEFDQRQSAFNLGPARHRFRLWSSSTLAGDDHGDDCLHV